MSGATTDDQLSPAAVYRLADRHQRLQTRRFQLLPLRGDGAAFTDVQGRGWGVDGTTSPAELVDLISSISSVGQLQPILVEEFDGGERRVVSGERRLRAMRWGSVNHPDNHHFAEIAAVLVDGPLSDEERRSWQLIENLARADLRPGELAAALLYERCALLLSRLVANGLSVPTEAATRDDPIERFDALDRVRREGELHHIGAPWSEVISRIGIQLTADKAKKLVKAFRSIPQELSSEMDTAEISLHSRMEFLKLHRGRRQAAEDIWEALRQREDSRLLLSRAVTEANDHPGAATGEIVEAADAFRQAANESRAVGAGRGSRTSGGSETTPDKGEAEADPDHAVTPVNPETTAGLRSALSGVLDQLRAGAVLTRYDRGSLRLHLAELDHHITTSADSADAA